jgi:hypothetical protein
MFPKTVREAKRERGREREMNNSVDDEDLTTR